MKDNQAKNNSIKRLNSETGSVFYEIMVLGQLDPQRSNWFEGMTLTNVENGESELACTLIAGPVIDQPALHGLLTKIMDLNLTLISVRRFFTGTSLVEQVCVKSELSKDRENYS